MKTLHTSVLLIFFFPIYAGAEEDWTKASSIRITKQYSGYNDCGSGTVIYCDRTGYLVLTCYHVVSPNKEGKLLAREVDGEWKSAEVASRWQRHDLATIYVKDPKHHTRAAAIAKKEDYPEGLKVRKCGYPLAGARHSADGRSTGKMFMGPDTSWISFTCFLNTRSGDSGGGLFRLSDRKLIGVVWGGDGSCAFVTRIESIQTLIKSAQDNGWVSAKQAVNEKYGD